MEESTSKMETSDGMSVSFDGNSVTMLNHRGSTASLASIQEGKSEGPPRRSKNRSIAKTIVGTIVALIVIIAVVVAIVLTLPSNGGDTSNQELQCEMNFDGISYVFSESQGEVNLGWSEATFECAGKDSESQTVSYFVSYTEIGTGTEGSLDVEGNTFSTTINDLPPTSHSIQVIAELKSLTGGLFLNTSSPAVTVKVSALDIVINPSISFKTLFTSGSSAASVNQLGEFSWEINENEVTDTLTVGDVLRAYGETSFLINITSIETANGVTTVEGAPLTSLEIYDTIDLSIEYSPTVGAKESSVSPQLYNSNVKLLSIGESLTAFFSWWDDLRADGSAVFGDEGNLVRYGYMENPDISTSFAFEMEGGSLKRLSAELTGGFELAFDIEEGFSSENVSFPTTLVLPLPVPSLSLSIDFNFNFQSTVAIESLVLVTFCAGFTMDESLNFERTCGNGEIIATTAKVDAPDGVDNIDAEFGIQVDLGLNFDTISQMELSFYAGLRPEQTRESLEPFYDLNPIVKREVFIDKMANFTSKIGIPGVAELYSELFNISITESLASIPKINIIDEDTNVQLLNDDVPTSVTETGPDITFGARYEIVTANKISSASTIDNDGNIYVQSASVGSPTLASYTSNGVFRWSTNPNNFCSRPILNPNESHLHVLCTLYNLTAFGIEFSIPFEMVFFKLDKNTGNIVATRGTGLQQTILGSEADYFTVTDEDVYYFIRHIISSSESGFYSVCNSSPGTDISYCGITENNNELRWLRSPLGVFINEDNGNVYYAGVFGLNCNSEGNCASSGNLFYRYGEELQNIGGAGPFSGPNYLRFDGRFLYQVENVLEGGQSTNSFLITKVDTSEVLDEQTQVISLSFLFISIASFDISRDANVLIIGATTFTQFEYISYIEIFVDLTSLQVIGSRLVNYGNFLVNGEDFKGNYRRPLQIVAKDFYYLTILGDDLLENFYLTNQTFDRLSVPPPTASAPSPPPILSPVVPTNSPSTMAPATIAPATIAPATMTPTTAAPVTQSPLSQGPEILTSSPAASPTDIPTLCPSTLSPETQSPVTQGPVLQTTSPSNTPRSPTASPVVLQTTGPTTEAPSASPSTDSPVTMAPSQTPQTSEPTSSPTASLQRSFSLDVEEGAGGYNLVAKDNRMNWMTPHTSWTIKEQTSSTCVLECVEREGETCKAEDVDTFLYYVGYADGPDWQNEDNSLGLPEIVAQFKL